MALLIAGKVTIPQTLKEDKSQHLSPTLPLRFAFSLTVFEFSDLSGFPSFPERDNPVLNGTLAQKGHFSAIQTSNLRERETTIKSISTTDEN